MEGAFWRYMNERMEEKNAEYDELPLQSTAQMYCAVDVNVDVRYKYTSNTVFVVLDCEDKKYDIFQVNTDEAVELNKTNSLCRGTMAYEMYEKTRI